MCFNSRNLQMNSMHFSIEQSNLQIVSYNESFDESNSFPMIVS